MQIIFWSIILLILAFLYIFVIRTFLACLFFKLKYSKDVVFKYNPFNGLLGYTKNSF
jgi:hypothetical protein